MLYHSVTSACARKAHVGVYCAPTRRRLRLLGSRLLVPLSQTIPALSDAHANVLPSTEHTLRWVLAAAICVCIVCTCSTLPTATLATATRYPWHGCVRPVEAQTNATFHLPSLCVVTSKACLQVGLLAWSRCIKTYETMESPPPPYHSALHSAYPPRFSTWARSSQLS